MSNHPGKKSERIASFLLERGISMTARAMYDAGFRFEDEETTVTKIGMSLTKLSECARYVLEKSYVKQDGHRMVSVRVKEIKGAPKRAAPDPDNAHLAMWRQLLTRKPGPVASKAAV